MLHINTSHQVLHILYYNELSLLVVNCLLKGCRLVELCEDEETMANGCLSLAPRVYNGLAVR